MLLWVNFARWKFIQCPHTMKVDVNGFKVFQDPTFPPCPLTIMLPSKYFHYFFWSENFPTIKSEQRNMFVFE